MRRATGCFLLGVVFAGFLASSTLACRGSRAPSATPPQLAPLIEALSEPGAYFDTDNLVSNETAYVQVVERLVPAGGAYLGVGPEQNFTYIGRIRPRWAFIVDLRRENMLQHLLFNAIFAQASTPYQYLCWLFSRPVREEPPMGADITEVVSRFEAAPPQAEVLERNLRVILPHIQDRLAVALTAEDRRTIRAMYESFFREQLEIRFRSHGRPPMSHHPTYRSLLLATAPSGRRAHFLASIDDYAYVRSLAAAGRLVPVVGDFAGPHALRAVGRFLKNRGETVSAFYVSNVEFYLLRRGRFEAYVNNLRSLPMREESFFIRAYFDYGLAHPATLPGHRSTVVLQRLPRFLSLFDAGAYRSYWDICTMDYQP